ncbi:MAG: hypothetical protein IJE19_04505 [Clostridia bacterium]|nr:hypothetical protein [Clostridia bacterium]
MKKTNKLISILIAVAMLLSMAPISAFAAAAPPTVEIGGKTYYEIDSADDLDWFAAQVNSGNTAINASLTKNITYNSGTMSASTTGARVWTPVGTRDNPFTGIFNGNGYTISGLYCKDPEDSPYLSLVAHSVKAIIANVAVTNFYFESRYGLVAGIASYAAGSTITNCYAQGSIYAKDAGAAAAGICAAVFGHSRTEILNCLADVALKVDDPSDFTVSGLSVRNYIGGIICTGDKDNPVLIQKTIYITDRYNGAVYDSDYALASHFEIYDSEGMPASKLSTGEIAYALGNGWGQKLGTDPMPVILSAYKVNYGYISCDVDAEKVYTNSAINLNYPWHYDSETDSDSACDFCGINLHTHSFEYTASGDTITAVCENTDGNCPDSVGTLTILAPADLYTDGTTAKEATIENNLVDTSVAISDITYSAPYGLPPKDAGNYTASVTVGGATATVEFTLLNYAAKVTDKDGNAVGTYKTFADAITAAQDNEGSTLTLLDNITLTSTQIIYSGKFTLDLNGKTLLNETGVTLQINKEANVTVKNSGEGGTVKTGGTNTPAISNLGTLTVDAGNIIGKKQAVNSSGTLTVNGGKFEAEYSLYISSGETVIEDGEFNGIVCVFASCTVNGGDFTAPRISINYEDGILTVNGGTFDIDEIRILAGTVSLAGGEFTNGFVLKSENTEDTLNSFLAEGYKFYDADGNKMTVADDATVINGYVKVKEHIVASVTVNNGGVEEVSYYKTFADAITAAQGSEGSTVTLLDDITLTTRQAISSGTFTLDLNGKTLLNETGGVLYIYEEVDLTIKDSGEGGTVETKRMYVDCIDNSGKLTVESGVIKGDGGIRNHGVLYFNDGTVEADNYPAIANYNDSTVYVYDGVLKGGKNSGAVENGGTLYVYGGEIESILNANDAYISGGKIDRDDYVALNLLGGTVEITGGSFTGTDFSDGYFSGTPYGEWTVDINEGATLILKGGEFPNGFVVANTTANAFLAEDYYYKDADGKLIDVAEDAKIINGYVKVSKGADLSDAVITVDKTEFVYNGQHQAPAVTVTIGGKTLTENVDYVVNARRWENGVPVQWFYYVDAGVYTSVIDGLGDYTGKVEKEFVIKPATVDIIWEGDEFYYTGNPHKVTAKYIDIDGNESNEFELINYVNTDVGVYTATAIFADNNYSATEAALNHTYEIKWYDGAPDAEIGGIKGENGWYIRPVIVTAPDGYVIDTLVDGTYGNTITFVENEENAVYYLKQTENGYIAKVELGEIKFDFENPTAEITVGENKWNSFLNTVTFGKFFKKTQSVTIEASDKTSGLAKIEYFIATEEITDFENIEWIEYTEKFNIEPNSKNIIYAKATDKAGRTIIINSDGIVLYTDSTLNVEDKDEVIYVLTKNADQAFNLNLNGNTVAYIKIDESVLGAEDYEVLGNMVLVSAEVLENLEAGEYIITVGFNPMGQVYVEGDAPAEVTIPLTVKKADVTIEISDIGKIYDGKPVTAEYKISKSSDSSPAVSNIKYNETVEFKVKGADNSTYTTEAPVNAGEYTVRITVAQTDKISYAQVTADFTIEKKAVTVTATAPDKVYDGTTDILEYSKVIVKIDGAVEGEMLGFTVGKAWYDTSDAGIDKTVHIIYAPVASNNIDNYEFPMNPEYSTDNCYVAAKADITKKAVSVSATVPDRIYGESVNCDTTKVVITFDGIVEGDDVGYVVTDATYYMHTVTDNAPVQVVYNVNGADSGNYQFPEFGEYLPPEYGVQATGRVLPRDIANAEITLGDALVYNGAEQTQTVAAVTVDGLEVTYTVSGNKAINVGVYELTITGNGNFAGETTALYEIAPDTTGVDVLTVDNVKSSDKEAIEAVAQQIENAVTDLADDEKKAEYKVITDKCDELLSKINDTANEIERIDEAVNGYDKETVTSADIPELSKLIDDIKALTDGDNLTEDEKAALEETDKAIDELIEKLAKVAEEIKKADEAVKSYDEETVKSTDSEDLAQLKEDIQALIDSDNTTENEKTALEEMIKDIEGLEDKIEEIETQLERIAGIENAYNPETVTSDDKSAIENAIAEIEAVNPDNLTDEQRKEYEEIKAGFEALLDRISAATLQVDAVGEVLATFDADRVTIFWEDDIEALKTKIDEILADENMGEAEKAKLNEYKAECDNLIVIIHTPVEYFSLRLFYFIWDLILWIWNSVVNVFSGLFGIQAIA